MNLFQKLLDEKYAEGMARGLARGRARGLATARREGRRATLQLLISTRFGAVPPALEERIATAGERTLLALIKKAATANRAEDI